MPAPGAAQPQEAVDKDAAFEKSIELVHSKLAQARRAPASTWARNVSGCSRIRRYRGHFFWPPPLVVDRRLRPRPHAMSLSLIQSCQTPRGQLASWMDPWKTVPAPW
jgi:hypothetical protein